MASSNFTLLPYMVNKATEQEDEMYPRRLDVSNQKQNTQENINQKDMTDTIYIRSYGGNLSPMREIKCPLQFHACLTNILNCPFY